MLIYIYLPLFQISLNILIIDLFMLSKPLFHFKHVYSLFHP